MVDGWKPIFLTVLALGSLLAALFIVQPYSADWPGRAYAKPARQFIRAALQEDSVRVARLSASSKPVIWALATARTHRDSLALWSTRIEAWTGARAGDTTEVVVYPAGEACHEAPIRFQFVGSGDDARVLSVASACLGSG
jgi:hypothetical protein